MPDRTVKHRLQDCDAALASDDGPIFSTVAKLVEALKRSIHEGMQNAELKQEASRLGHELAPRDQVRKELETGRTFSERASFYLEREVCQNAQKSFKSIKLTFQGVDPAGSCDTLVMAFPKVPPR
jgi:hypothetical protein